jgi:hypothetical protein
MKIRSLAYGQIVCAALFCAATALAKDSPTLVPLRLYYNSDTGDNFTFATSVSESDAKEKGYEAAGTQGYVFTSAQRGTVPLKLYWNTSRRDYLLVATPQGEKEARDFGYEFVRVEGYAFRSSEPGTVPLKRSWKGVDNFT